MGAEVGGGSPGRGQRSREPLAVGCMWASPQKGSQQGGPWGGAQLLAPEGDECPSPAGGRGSLSRPPEVTPGPRGPQSSSCRAQPSLGGCRREVRGTGSRRHQSQEPQSHPWSLGATVPHEPTDPDTTLHGSSSAVAGLRHDAGPSPQREKPGRPALQDPGLRGASPHALKRVSQGPHLFPPPALFAFGRDAGVRPRPHTGQPAGTGCPREGLTPLLTGRLLGREGPGAAGGWEPFPSSARESGVTSACTVRGTRDTGPQAGCQSGWNLLAGMPTTLRAPHCEPRREPGIPRGWEAGLRSREHKPAALPLGGGCWCWRTQRKESRSPASFAWSPATQRPVWQDRTGKDGRRADRQPGTRGPCSGGLPARVTSHLPGCRALPPGPRGQPWGARGAAGEGPRAGGAPRVREGPRLAQQAEPPRPGPEKRSESGAWPGTGRSTSEVLWTRMPGAGHQLLLRASGRAPARTPARHTLPLSFPPVPCPGGISDSSSPFFPIQCAGSEGLGRAPLELPQAHTRRQWGARERVDPGGGWGPRGNWSVGGGTSRKRLEAAGRHAELCRTRPRLSQKTGGRGARGGPRGSQVGAVQPQVVREPRAHLRCWERRTGEEAQTAAAAWPCASESVKCRRCSEFPSSHIFFKKSKRSR